METVVVIIIVVSNSSMRISVYGKVGDVVVAAALTDEHTDQPAKCWTTEKQIKKEASRSFQ